MSKNQAALKGQENDPEETNERKTPRWLTSLLDQGYLPYIATSKRLLPHYNLTPFGIALHPFVMEEANDKDFLEAYLLSNSLSFKSSAYKMPSWVFVDCVLLPECVVGFMKATQKVPQKLLAYYQNDLCINFDRLFYIPVSGEIDSMAADGSFINL